MKKDRKEKLREQNGREQRKRGILKEKKKKKIKRLLKEENE